jgi:hypothetical protein
MPDRDPTTSLRISRPNQNHMKQSDLGKSLDPSGPWWTLVKVCRKFQYKLLKNCLHKINIGAKNAVFDCDVKTVKKLEKRFFENTN